MSAAAMTRSHTTQSWPEPGPNQVMKHFSGGRSPLSSFSRTTARIRSRFTVLTSANGVPTTRSCYPRRMIPATMRASFYEGPGRFATGSVATPALAPGEALLRVRRVGICGTDLHIFQGHLDHRVPRGGVIGHETFAEVVEAPKDSGFAAGDRVVVEAVVAEINEFRLGLLGTLGLPTLGRGHDAVKFVNEWTDGVGVDVAFEVTGRPEAVRAVTDVVRVWGTISIVAIHAEPMAVNLYQMFARELTMHGSRLYTRAAWEEAIRLAASGAVPLAPLVSRKIPLDALTEGMQAALGGANVMKVLVEL